MFEFIEKTEKNSLKHNLTIAERNQSLEYRLTVKENDLIYYLDKDNNIKSEMVLKIIGKIHSFGMGWGLMVELKSGETVSTFYCFPTPEDICEILIDRIADEEKTKNRSLEGELQLPIITAIHPKTLAEDIVSVQPMLDKNSDLFKK